MQAAMVAPTTVGGLGVPRSLPVGGAVAGAFCGFLLPDVLVHVEATERRAEFRRALSAFLDLAVVVLAGGGGVETALYRASRAGSGWAPARIRGALEAAQATRISPWTALESLAGAAGSVLAGQRRPFATVRRAPGMSVRAGGAPAAPAGR